MKYLKIFIIPPSVTQTIGFAMSNMSFAIDTIFMKVRFYSQGNTIDIVMLMLCKLGIKGT